MGRQNKELFKNIEIYEQKKKAEQQKPKVLGQKPVKRTKNKEEKTNVHNTSRLYSVRNMV